jgi:hypothetical protein
VALAPADFYAYTRATGIPYPETPEERAEMAPEVLSFRRNQLKSPGTTTESGGNPLSIGIGIGLGLAGLGGAGLLARRLLKSGKATGQSSVTQTDLSNYNISNLRQAASRTPEPTVSQSKVATQQPVTAPVEAVVDLDALTSDTATRLLQEYDRLAESQARADQRVQAGLREREMQIRGAGERVLAELRQESLVEKQQANAGLNINQALNAVESGEDQATGRIKNQLQRNEDLDLSQIEVLENIAEQDRNWMMQQDEPISRAAASLPDGVPIDQASGMSSAARFMQRERDEIASQLGELGFPVSPSRIEKELANRLSGSEAWTYGPKYTKRKQALQLGATYEPEFFENLKTPSVRIAGETIPTEQLKEPVAMEATAQRLQERADSKRDWLGQVRLEEQKNKVRLMNISKDISALQSYKDEVTSFLASGKASPDQMRLGKQRLNDLSVDLDRLDTQQAELTNLVYYGDKRIAGARSSVEQSISELELPQKLKSGIEEGQRLFFEVDPLTNQPLPGTQELRSEKYAIDTDPKTGGGRNYAMYDPESQVGSSIGIYGIEPRDYPIADPELRPTALQREETKTTLRRMPTEGPALETYIEETKRARSATPETKQRSLVVSEAMRRARIEGRDPNMVLRTLGFNL